jgi:hypothetical protein
MDGYSRRKKEIKKERKRETKHKSCRFFLQIQKKPRKSVHFAEVRIVAIFLTEFHLLPSFYVQNEKDDSTSINKQEQSKKKSKIKKYKVRESKVERKEERKEERKKSRENE